LTIKPHHRTLCYDHEDCYWVNSVSYKTPQSFFKEPWQDRRYRESESLLFPLKFCILHFISSIDRISILIDEQRADIFDCGSYSTHLPSRCNRYLDCRCSTFLIRSATLKLHFSYNFDEKCLQRTLAGGDELLCTRDMNGYIVENYDLIVRRVNYISRHQITLSKHS
jgi:hypothetical protein